MKAKVSMPAEFLVDVPTWVLRDRFSDEARAYFRACVREKMLERLADEDAYVRFYFVAEERGNGLPAQKGDANDR